MQNEKLHIFFTVTQTGEARLFSSKKESKAVPLHAMEALGRR
jgi:hypothetical protein